MLVTRDGLHFFGRQTVRRNKASTYNTTCNKRPSHCIQIATFRLTPQCVSITGPLVRYVFPYNPLSMRLLVSDTVKHCVECWIPEIIAFDCWAAPTHPVQRPLVMKFGTFATQEHAISRNHLTQLIGRHRRSSARKLGRSYTWEGNSFFSRFCVWASRRQTSSDTACWHTVSTACREGNSKHQCVVTPCSGHRKNCRITAVCEPIMPAQLIAKSTSAVWPCEPVTKMRPNHTYVQSSAR